MAGDRNHKPTPTHLIAVQGVPGFVEAVKVGYGDHGMTAHVISERYDQDARAFVFEIMSRFYPYGGFTFVQDVNPVVTYTPTGKRI